MKNIAIIGLGYWGKNLVREFNKLNVIHSICDSNKKLLLTYKDNYPDINLTTSYDEILNNPEISAIVIALPSELHFKYAYDGLLHNKDVFVEKPLSLNIEDCDKLIKLSKINNKILMVGHLLQYHPAINKIYELIDNNYIGDIKYIISNRLNLGKIRKEENVLWSFAPHDISIILKLMKNKMPNSIISNGKSFISTEKNIYDITSTILDYDNTYVQINVNWLNPFKEQKLTIVGSLGMITFDDTIENKITYYQNNIFGKDTSNPSQIIEYDKSKSPLECECEYFIKCCKERLIPITNGEEGRNVLSILDLAQKSLESNGVKKYITVNSTTPFIHETAIVSERSKIGNGTKIWHFTHIMEDAEIGENCNIGQNVFIGKGVKIGNNCKIQNNVSVYSGVIAEDDVFFGPSCVLTNDKTPRAYCSKNGNYMKTYIKKGASLGANSTIICGITLGEYCMIGAGAVVTKDVKPYKTMIGNPAKELINNE